MVMNDLFRPSERALAFGEQYAQVLARWSELFKAASELVDANVQLGHMTNDAAKEFDQLLRQTANAPWNWFGPEMVQRFMEGMAPKAKPNP
ncbi:MAG: hypothetical protein ACKVVT_12765 [Dehalococcoidia bacterium]